MEREQDAGPPPAQPSGAPYPSVLNGDKLPFSMQDPDQLSVDRPQRLTLSLFLA
jgi:hypothetical protein